MRVTGESNYRRFEGPYMTREDAEDRAADLREMFGWVLVHEMEAAA